MRTDGTEWRNRLRRIREANNDAAWAMAEYISETPCAITQKLMEQVNPGGTLPEEAVYAALMAGFCGINENDRETNGYFSRAVKRLDTRVYLNDPYLASIRFPDAVSGKWRFTHYCYRPYEAFVRDDIMLGPGTVETPSVGFFTGRFIYPAVEQDGREWMAVKPSEIETMRGPLSEISGKVAVFGLGLGYFAYMATLNQAVKEIDIIEIDNDAISLFSRHILPQIQNRDKIAHIIKQDAFEYMSDGMEARKYDFAFVDLWHDASDGLPMYIRAKRLERLNPDVKFIYWVEKTLRSAWRWNEFERIIDSSMDEEEALYSLSAGILPE
ncbi:MAG: hypothetical protein ACI3ZO_08750 [Candidatus Cryptobacteroides sp.]